MSSLLTYRASLRAEKIEPGSGQLVPRLDL